MNRMLVCLALGLALIGPAEAQKRTKYSVMVSVTGSGTVTSSTGGISCPTVCSGSVNSGTAVTFTATPGTGATFSGWGDSCAASGTASTCTLTIAADSTLSATFTGGGGGGGTTIEQLETRISELEALVTSLSNSLNGFEDLFAGVTRGPDQYSQTDTLYFDGMNVAIRSGVGSTDAAVNGKGNLIIGYNEANSEWWTQGPELRAGSHNLIIGEHHSYSSYGGVIAGKDNTNAAPNSSVLGGGLNRVLEYGGAVLGGAQNTTSGAFAAIAGGGENDATGAYDSILGGRNNSTSGGRFNSVAGGRDNVAGGNEATTVLGGYGNQSYEYWSTIIGGDQVYCAINWNPSTGEFQAAICGEALLSEPD